MANPEHLETLKRGAHAWNNWRQANPRFRPDLSGATLKKRSLRNYDLRGVNFAGADLRDASFRHADLRGADLTGAKLHRAFFSASRLHGTDFRKSLLYETVFANVNLGRAKNVDGPVHRGPSVVDHRTLARSGDLPLAFLRGCGLPDSLIAQDRKKRIGANPYSSCFISYSCEDQGFADQLHADLQNHGVRCWFAPKDMRIGAKIRDTIDEAIREMGKLLLVLSESATASAWVEKEFETAFEEERFRDATVVLPIRIDNAPLKSKKAWMADIRRTRNIGDFSNWHDEAAYKKAVNQLLQELAHTDE